MEASQKKHFNPYDVLGVTSSASKDEIKTAYHRLALRYHPDSGAGGGNVEKFNAVKEAYDLLKQGKPWYSEKRTNGSDNFSSTSNGRTVYTYETPGSTNEGYVSGKTEIYLRVLMVCCFMYVFLVFFFERKKKDDVQAEEGPMSVHQEE